MTPTARLIVCERTGRWASALRREWGAPAPRIRETRHLDDAWEALRDATASLVIVEASWPRVPGVAGWLARLGRAYPQVQALVVGEEELQPAEWLLREAGARWVHMALRDPAVLVRLARRQLARFRAADRTWREQYFSRLPWPEAGDPA